EPQESGLPGAVRADESHDLVPAQLEADVVDREQPAEATGEALYAEERIGHCQAQGTRIAAPPLIMSPTRRRRRAARGARPFPRRCAAAHRGTRSSEALCIRRGARGSRP